MLKLGHRAIKPARLTAPQIKPEWRGIVEQELNKHQVHIRDILGPRGSSNIVNCRWIIWRRLNDERGATSTRLGQQFGRHHTTVLHALGRIKGKRKPE